MTHFVGAGEQALGLLVHLVGDIGGGFAQVLGGARDLLTPDHQPFHLFPGGIGKVANKAADQTLIVLDRPLGRGIDLPLRGVEGAIFVFEAVLQGPVQPPREVNHRFFGVGEGVVFGGGRHFLQRLDALGLILQRFRPGIAELDVAFLGRLGGLDQGCGHVLCADLERRLHRQRGVLQPAGAAV